MNALRLLIADGTEEFCRELADVLRRTYQVRVSGDGREALELLRTFSPDILVLDLMLPGLDGLGLLQQAVNEGHHPMVLATTRFVSNYVLESAQKLGVGYLMIKPCNVNAVVMRIADLSEQLKKPSSVYADPMASASAHLLTLGVPTKLRGYGCLREAVMQMAKDPSQSVTKELYPSVAARCGGNARQVERAIRGAIQTAWSKRDEDIWRLYFQPGADGKIPRPTNAAFISRLADFLILEESSAE